LEKRVGTFHPRRWYDYWTNIWSFVMIITSIASAFGGIHCIGWSFTFPSSIERTLWRVASLSITTLPIPLFLTIVLADNDWLGSVSTKIMLYFAWPQLFLYVLSRLALLILPFLTLRSLPPATYHTVDWTSFIPHI